MSVKPIISKKSKKNKFEYFDKSLNTKINVSAFRIDVCDALSGLRYRKTHKVDFNAAKLIEKRILKAIKDGRIDLIENAVNPKPKTVGELFNLFKKEKSKNTDRAGTGLSDSTFKRYYAVINSFLTTDTLIDKLNTNYIERRINVRLENGVSKSSINTDLRHLKSLFKWGSNSKLVSENSFDSIPFFKVKLKEPRILTPNEMVEIEKICKPTKWFVLYKLYLLTGARLSELLKPKLKWEHIDLENRTIKLPIRKREKSSVIPLSEQMVQLLSQLKKDGFIKKTAIENEDTDFPFPFSYHYVGKVFRKIFDDAGLEDVTVHDLRRSFASYLISMGCSTADVSMLMGHSSIQVTENHYITQLSSRKSEVIQNLENLFNNIKSDDK